MDTATLGIKAVDVTTTTGAQSAITALDMPLKWFQLNEAILVLSKTV